MIEDKAKAFIDNLVLPTALRIVPLPTIPKIKVKTYNLKKGTASMYFSEKRKWTICGENKQTTPIKGSEKDKVWTTNLWYKFFTCSIVPFLYSVAIFITLTWHKAS